MKVTQVESLAEAEGYLAVRGQMAGLSKCSARIIHSYEAFKSKYGETVRVGTGLTHNKMWETAMFLLGPEEASEWMASRGWRAVASGPGSMDSHPDDFARQVSGWNDAD